MTDLLAPHGGTLINVMASAAERKAYEKLAQSMPSWNLTQRQLCDLELILNGGFSPLTGFMGRADYDAVVETMRLQDGSLWPMPITLDVDQTFADQIDIGSAIALRDPEGVLLAVLEISDKWQPDKTREAQGVFQTVDDKHPGVNYLFRHTHDIYLGGRVIGMSLPQHYDFTHIRLTPAQLRSQLRGPVVAFQTRNPMHRAHVELTQRAASMAKASLLIHPVVGMTKPGDVDHFTRVRCYESILATYPAGMAQLSLLPLAMRMGGPREALWHAIIRKNYGCSHFIVGRDHAGPGNDSHGQPFYGPYDAQVLVEKHQAELGITMVPFQEMVFVADQNRYLPVNEVQNQSAILRISGTELRRRLREGEEIPAWFSYPKVVSELRLAYPPKYQQGVTLFFTGLSGAGKSTIANALMTRLMEKGDRTVTLLDGDIVRKNLSSELTFSKEHRDLNIKRIGFVAKEITKHRGIALCAPIAPYNHVRREVREMISEVGHFIEIYISTPLNTCEQRDRKGLYAKARAGQIKHFTGIDDPYEIPENPELVIDTTNIDPAQAVENIISYLKENGFVQAMMPVMERLEEKEVVEMI